ncbi:MAG: glycosyltransferase, partial [Anaerolineales bacterium]|nr:glycosyltransferase [Anaerolineales bacterium]
MPKAGSTMRLGIDITALPPQTFGAANYILNLVQSLLRSDATNEYVIFTKPLHAPLFDSTRARIVQSALPSPFLRIAWEQTALPLLARQQRLDLLHSPHYTMPLAKSCRAVVTFHDMTFFLYPEVHLRYKRLFFRAMIPWSARRADALIAISHSTRADILRILQTPPDQVIAIPYGIAPQFQPIP